MLNLLTVSAPYANHIYQQWYHVDLLHSHIINICLILLFLSFVLFLVATKHNFHITKGICNLVFILSFIGFIGELCWVAYTDSYHDSNYRTPVTLEYGNLGVLTNHINPYYSSHSLLHVNHTVLHNKKLISQEWHQNKSLYAKSHIKNVNRLTQKQYQRKQYYANKYYHQLHVIKHQAKFDKFNNKFLNKHYIHSPHHSDYL